MNRKSLTFIVPIEYDNKNCKEFLKYYCNISARLITRLVRTEMGITRDNQLLRTIDNVYVGDKVVINLPNDSNEITPTKGELNVIYEDDYILVVDKPPLMPVHPTKNHQTDTLANIVRYYSLNKNEDYTFRAINRIDRDTSGLVVIAKNRFVANKIKSLYKEYTAVCCGNIVEDGTVNKNIKLKENSKMVREVSDDGAKAVTHYKVINRSPSYTEILCTLETGRTHQIRCHMSYLGYPLAGDDLYGGSLEHISRQALHCSKVIFTHPISKEKIVLESSLPFDIKYLLKY